MEILKQLPVLEMFHESDIPILDYAKYLSFSGGLQDRHHLKSRKFRFLLYAAKIF